MPVTSVDLNFDHELLPDGSATLCGITKAEGIGKVHICCACHRRDCTYPLTCPACLAIWNRRPN